MVKGLRHEPEAFGSTVEEVGLPVCQWVVYLDLDRDLSYGEILAGQPGAWLVKKIFFICMQ